MDCGARDGEENQAWAGIGACKARISFWVVEDWHRVEGFGAIEEMVLEVLGESWLKGRVIEVIGLGEVACE